MMKRYRLAALCAVLAIGLCACGGPKTADPDDYGYTVTQQDNGTYTIRVEAGDGSDLYLRERMPTEPKCMALTEDVLQIVGDTNDGHSWVMFCDVTEDRVSTAFANYVAANSTKVAYVDYLTDAYHLFVRDIFDETIYLEATTLVGLVVDDDNTLIKDAKLRHGKLTVTYKTTVGDTTITMDMPE